MYYNLINPVIEPIIEIPLYDLCLCILFTKKARWFQLHCFINIMIVQEIYKDIFNLLLDPLDIKVLEHHKELYYILYLHLYHMIFFKNTTTDYFHHIVFVLFGTFPIYHFYNVNLIRLATFTGCGLPGVIEYFTLSLVKHEKIKSLTQKTIMVYVYNYFRYPVSVFAASLIYYNHAIGLTNYISNFCVLYTIFLIIFNSAYFNKLTIENRTWHKLSIR
tara:strand:+ start:1053 stop:1706 length:654 start_codon:yes stop_codon:yes gene_type:complete